MGVQEDPINFLESEYGISENYNFILEHGTKYDNLIFVLFLWGCSRGNFTPLPIFKSKKFQI